MTRVSRFIIVLSIVWLGFFAVSGAVMAQADPSTELIGCAPGKYCPQVPIPGLEGLQDDVANPQLLANYIVGIFRFGVWIAISLAVFMIMLAGFQWLTAGGDGGKVSSAKEKISNALTGLVIALFSFVILQTINPALVELKLPSITRVDSMRQASQAGSDCCWDPGSKAVKANITVPSDANGNKICSALNDIFTGTWESCTSGSASACVCVTDYRPHGGAQYNVNCDTGWSQSECDSQDSQWTEPRLGGFLGGGGVPRECTFYAQTVCEIQLAKLNLQSSGPLGTIKFEAAQ